jgi:phosphate starvation-inducible protein PhoH and related proteins
MKNTSGSSISITNSSVQTTICEFKSASNAELANVCGAIDANLRAIEAALDVTIARRTDSFTLKGMAVNVSYAQSVLRQLMHRAIEPIALETVALELLEYRNVLAQAQAGGLPVFDAELLSAETMAHAAKHAKTTKHNQAKKAQALLSSHGLYANSVSADVLETSTAINTATPTAAIELRTRKVGLTGRTANQRAYIQNVLAHDLTFGVGPAGTGKTYLAVACAVDALERDLVKRIVLTRPAVEAGERLGFLPGDLAQKIDPYLRPLYDALYDLMGYEKTQKLFEKQVIEIAPLAYMRGRTLSHAFIILDEAQNTSCEQMKMFLTRTGFGSKVVVTGDMSQVDLPRGTPSGLRDALIVLAGVEGVAVNMFASVDVVRHPLVGSIVDAYEKAAQG